IIGLPMSTDFTGGTNVTLAVPEGTTTAQVREAVGQVGVEGMDPQAVTIVESTNQSGRHEMILRTGLTTTAAGGSGSFASDLATLVNGEVLNSDFVGPAIGADLRNGAIMAVLVSLALILVYVAWRFWPNWAVA